MITFHIKQGDTLPSLEATLVGPDGEPINLQGTSVTFCMGRSVRGPCEVVDAAQGRVRYVWQPGDTDEPGTWSAEFVVTNMAGETQRVPNNGYLIINIARAVCGRCEA